ncbi:MAG: phosphotransferase [Candidatus Omnitrophica bacterium]|nr:phosphotransferase [Candidatus Omnitrophota bacterium]
MNRENAHSSSSPRYDWLEEALLAVCQNAFPSESVLRVHSLTRRMQRIGAHCDYEFILQLTGGEIRLALRLYQGTFSLWGFSDRVKSARAYTAMRRAYKAGVPAPFPYTFTSQRIPFGKPYVLHDPGDGRRWWNVEDSLRPAQGQLVTSMAEELVKLHHAVAPDPDWIPAVEVGGVLYQIWNRIAPIAGDELTRCFEKASRKFQDEEVDARAMLHGQFDLDHLLIKNGVIRTITDWEFAACGDPRWDVAYASLSLQRGRDHSLSNQFVSHYANLSQASLEHLPLWEGLVALRDWALSVWLESLDEKSFQSVAGLQTPLMNKKDVMREHALHVFS